MFSNIKAKIVQEAVKEQDKYVTKNKPANTRGDGLIQITAAGVGFVSEIVHHRRERKMRGEGVRAHDAAPAKTDGLSVPSQGPDETASNPTPLPKDLAAAFISRHPYFSPSPPPPPLQTPILIPQRRPNTRARGFAPAYVPILSSFSISKPTFLDFITTFNISLELNPYLNAINFAGFAGEVAPDPFSLLIGFGVEVAMDVVMEAQSRVKSNGFLERLNEAFFAPRGLFAFVNAWRPGTESDGSETDGGVAATESGYSMKEVRKSIGAGDLTAWRDVQKRMRRSIVPASGRLATVTSALLIWASAEEVSAITRAAVRRRTDLVRLALGWMSMLTSIYKPGGLKIIRSIRWRERCLNRSFGPGMRIQFMLRVVGILLRC